MHPPALSNNENKAPKPSNTSPKMFSCSLPPTYTQSSPFSFQQSNFYTPSQPSPLSPSLLRANRSPLSERQNENENPAYSFTMSSPPPAPSQFFAAQPSSTFSAQSTAKRIVKKNPLIHRDEKDGGRETRRKLFLKRVREDSEDKSWEKKGGDDELLRAIYVADHKRGIRQNLKYDAAYDETPEDYEVDINSQINEPAALNQPSLTRAMSPTAEQQMAEEVARQEEAELQAYLEMMEVEHNAHGQQQLQAQSVPQFQPATQRQRNPVHIHQSASDDIDYDKMFEDMNMGRAQNREQGHDNGVPDDEDMMDMS